MVDPAWFFSTLPQATAAIVGLLVSLSAIQYQLERQRRQSRTEDFREELLKFDEKFGDLIPVIAGQLFYYPDGQFMSTSANLEESIGKLNFRIAREAYRPTRMIYWAQFSRISHILIFGIEPSPDPKSHYLPSDLAFTRLRESVNWLSENFDERSEYMDILIADLEIEGNNPYLRNIFDADPPDMSVRDWLLKYYSYAERQEQIYSGENLQSFQRIVEELSSDFQQLDAVWHNTIVNFEPRVNEFLIRSVLLLVIGVFLPILSLSTDVPGFLSWLVIDSTLLYLYEVILLFATLVLSLSLIAELQRRFGEKTIFDDLASRLPDGVRDSIKNMVGREA